MHIEKHSIIARDLPDAFFQALRTVYFVGTDYTIERGSFKGAVRRQLDYITIHVLNPYVWDSQGFPLIPTPAEGSNKIPPISKEYIHDYVHYIISGAKSENEQYTYGERILENGQLTAVIDMLRENPATNQACIQIGKPSDINLPDPPCLRTLDFFVKDRVLNTFAYFRSWDCWGGLPANLAGLSVLSALIAQEANLELGEMVINSKGLHIYNYAFEVAKQWIIA